MVVLQTQEEFQEVYLRPVNVSGVSDHKRKHVRDSDDSNNRTYPSWLDWRLKGFVTDVGHLCNNMPLQP